MPYPPAPDGRARDGAGMGALAAPPTVTAFTPRARLYTERMILNAGSAFAPDQHEELLPVIELSFDYGGAAGPDQAGERQARQLLEGFGAVELACLEAVDPPSGRAPTTSVRIDEDIHALLLLHGYALPQLRALGWRVEVAPDYPFQVVDGDAPLYARDSSRSEAATGSTWSWASRSKGGG